MKPVALIAFAGATLGRTFTVYNACPFTIWPAVFVRITHFTKAITSANDRYTWTDLNVRSATPGIGTGWEAAAYTKRTFNVPNNWKAGRIWGRRNCNFGSNPGPNSCADGGCNSGLKCDTLTFCP